MGCSGTFFVENAAERDQNGPKWSPGGAKMDQNGALEGPKWTKMEPGRCLGGTLEAQMGQRTEKRGQVTSGPRFWVDFGSILEAILGSFLGTFSHLFSVSFLASILGSFFVDFGAIFGHFLETERVWGGETRFYENWCFA